MNRVPGEAMNLVRLGYFGGEWIGLPDWRSEQEYHLLSTRDHNRYLHAWGIAANGLQVTKSLDGDSVVVESGLAIDSEGREIFLPKSRTVHLSEQAGVYYLTIAYHEILRDWKQEPAGAGFKRIVEEPVIGVQTEPPGSPGIQLLLAEVTIGVDGRIVGISRAGRRDAGIEVDRLCFVLPNLESNQWPAIALYSGIGSPGLGFTAPLTEFTRNVEVRESVGIGSLEPSAALEIAGTAALKGTGLLTAGGGTLVTGRGTAFLEEIQNGDFLTVITGDRVSEFRVVEVLDEQRLVIDLPLSSDGSPYTYRRKQVVQMNAANGQTILSVDGSGYVGIGTSQPEARLHVAGGSIYLDSGASLKFEGTGQISGGGGQNEVLFRSSINLLELRSRGSISLSAAFQEKDELATPSLVLSQEGKIGLGQVEPTQKLDVKPPEGSPDPAIWSLEGGYMFPDGTVQNSAAVSVPIGTVLDWWLPEAQEVIIPDGFMICDGGALPPNSPLAKYETNVPNLSGRLVRGVGFREQNREGGSDEHHHSVTVLRHDHGISHVHERLDGVRTSNALSRMAHGDFAGSGDVAKFDHHHDFELSFQPAAPPVSGIYSDYRKDTEPAESLPGFIRLLKIIRVF